MARIGTWVALLLPWIVAALIIPCMNTSEIIQTIDAEIARLEKARALLNGQSVRQQSADDRSGSKPAVTLKPQRRKMSAEGRARIAAAQKARWAKAKGK